MVSCLRLFFILIDNFYFNGHLLIFKNTDQTNINAGVISLVSELQTVLDTLQTERDALLKDKGLANTALPDQTNTNVTSIIIFDFDQTIIIF